MEKQDFISKIIKTLLITIISCSPLLSYSQSPWAKSKGDGFTQLSFTTIPEYNLIFKDGNKTRYSERLAVDNTIQSFNEIGIGKDLSLLIVLPLKMQKLGQRSVFDANEDEAYDFADSTEAGNLTGVSNISVGLRKGFQIKSMNAAVQLKVDLPTYVYDDATGMSTGYNATSINALYSIGKGFSENSYFFLYTGGTFRTNNYSSMVIFGGEYGRRFFKQLWVIPFIDFNFSLRNGTIALPEKQINNAFYINDQEYTAMGLKLIEELSDKIGLTLGLGGTFTAHNVSKSPAISLGGYYKW